MKPKYSGKNSKKFWHKIAAIKNGHHAELYSLGVALQNLEQFVLKRFNEETKEFKPKKK